MMFTRFLGAKAVRRVSVFANNGVQYVDSQGVRTESF